MTNAATVRVLLAQADMAVRLQLRRLLRDAPDIEVVGQVLGSGGLPAAIQQTGANCLVIDVTDPSQPGAASVRDFSGIERMLLLCTDPSSAARLREAGPHIVVERPRDLSAESPDGAFAVSIRSLLRGGSPDTASPVTSQAPLVLQAASPTGFDLLAIGASTGGPEALTRVLAGLAGQLPVPVVITQHIASEFTAALAETLSATGVPTVLARDDTPLLPGRAYLAPGGAHLRVLRRGDRLLCRLDDGPPENFCKPAVDVMLRSLAGLRGIRTLALILTGMGQDGLAGCQALMAAQGRVLAQDEASAVVWGMPGAVARAGLCAAVLPLTDLSGAVLANLGRRR